MFVVIFVCAIIALFAISLVLRANETEKRYILYGGREFNVYCSAEFGGKMCVVSIWEIVHPNRKIFRTKYRDTRSFWCSDFVTIKEGIYSVINGYIVDEEEEKQLREKWDEV